MFYTKFERERVEKEFDALTEKIDLLTSKVEVLTIQVDAWNKVLASKATAEIAPYGIRKDGKPRAKPGRPRKAA